ncbi:MAG: beta-galactosidase [Lachnospiraceae bacterium]|nr:beta-galactosidase [Lachnospiraceae bacterium]
MEKKALFPQVGRIIHGGDYNPEQWLDRPDILEEDIRLMKKAGINEATLGVFSWSMLEPREGEFDFTWLKEIVDKLYENGIYTIMATPSGARPAWLDEKYPEARRVNKNGVRELHGIRHNHCMTSPKYRELVRIMDEKLGEMFGNHPGVIMWHISNEFGGECYCDKCVQKFRDYLRQKFDGDIEKLNHAWWNTFWSHNFNNFDQINPPFSHGEFSSMGLSLEWRRFTTINTADFCRAEIETLKKYNPDKPATTNFMTMYDGLDYRVMEKDLDVISWDSYPRYHNDYEKLSDTFYFNAFCHAQMRSMKRDKPFMLMESVPSLVNWHDVNKLKKPGVHKLTCLQAVAMGSDTVQYFQWRKGRGSFEQYHGAVIDHLGSDDTRVFREVADVGETLLKLKDVCGTTLKNRAAIIYDWDTRWAFYEVRAFAHDTIRYDDTCISFYKTMAKLGIECDIVASDSDLSQYEFVIAPQMYMLRNKTSANLKNYVKNGGVLLATYMCGYVDEDQLCYLGGFPGDGLKDVFGVTIEEIDAYYPSERNTVKTDDGEVYTVRDYAEILRDCKARVLATYGGDFYEGSPAITENACGSGHAIYLAARIDETSQEKLIKHCLGLTKTLASECERALPEEVGYFVRCGENNTFEFFLNYSEETKNIGNIGTDMLTGEEISALKPYQVAVVKH